MLKVDQEMFKDIRKFGSESELESITNKADFQDAMEKHILVKSSTFYYSWYSKNLPKCE